MNYHRNHVRDFADIACKLYSLTAPQETFAWSPEHESAFEALKDAVTSASVLAYPDPDGQFVLDTDASDFAVGAELSKILGDQTRVIAYASYTLGPQQRNYCTRCKELLAVVLFTRHFRHYLLGSPFLLWTDHSSLTWLLPFRNLNGQLARWLEELSQYDMRVLHRPGAKHGNADSLSLIPDVEGGCSCYIAGRDLRSLPCGGCNCCERVQNIWQKFEEDVDDVIPPAV